MQIQYISNRGEGSNEFIQVRDGLTVGELFSLKESGDFSQYTVRINNVQTFNEDTILNPNDKVTFTPTNQKGA